MLSSNDLLDQENWLIYVCFVPLFRITILRKLEEIVKTINISDTWKSDSYSRSKRPAWINQVFRQFKLFKTLSMEIVLKTVPHDCHTVNSPLGPSLQLILVDYTFLVSDEQLCFSSAFCFFYNPKHSKYDCLLIGDIWSKLWYNQLIDRVLRLRKY